MKRLVGFTLTELLVVMAIIAIMTMMTLPVVAPIFRNKAIDASVTKVQGVLMKARSLAATTNNVYYVSFNTIDDSKNLLIIYQYDSTFTALNNDPADPPSKWNDNWADTSDRKKMIVDKPVYLDPQTKFYFQPDLYGDKAYIKVYPNGSVVVSTNFFDDTVANMANAAAIYPTKDDGIAPIVIMDSGVAVDDFDKAGTDKTVHKLIGLYMLTGALYTN